MPIYAFLSGFIPSLIESLVCMDLDYKANSKVEKICLDTETMENYLIVSFLEIN
jgi:hypothetical protein